MRKPKKADTDVKKKQGMRPFSSVLGLIFGAAAGTLLGILLRGNMAVYTAVGAGAGLICGAVLSLYLSKGEG